MDFGKPRKRYTLNIRRNVPRRWSELSYAGESRVPFPVDSTAGSWPTFFLGRNPNGEFTDGSGQAIALDIRHPDTINFVAQLETLKGILKHLTPQQITIAEYWNSGPPTKQWTPIIDRLIDTYDFTPVRAGRVLAAVQAAISDVFVVIWYLKFLWDVPRPNQLDQQLRTIVCTPRFPTYPSGHSTVAGTAEVVLSYFFPPEAERLRELAEENSISRTYAGVHFPIDTTEGLKLGRQIGRIIVEILRQQRDLESIRVDVAPTEGRNASLPPGPYKQVIRYPRGRSCTSLLDPRQDPDPRS